MNLFLTIDSKKVISLKQYIFSGRRIFGERLLATISEEGFWGIRRVRPYSHVDLDLEPEEYGCYNNVEQSYDIEQIGVPILITGTIIMSEGSEYLQDVCNSYLYYLNIFNYYTPQDRKQKGNLIFNLNKGAAIDDEIVTVGLAEKNKIVGKIVREGFTLSWVRSTNVVFPINILKTKRE